MQPMCMYSGTMCILPDELQDLFADEAASAVVYTTLLEILHQNQQ